jgi:mycofactocin precursor
MATDTVLENDLVATETDAVTTDELDDEELLVEEISIDGMCGVY